jgi:outer membrane lipoprotein
MIDEATEHHPMFSCPWSNRERWVCMQKVVVLFVLALLLHGCTYAISRSMTAQEDKTITFRMLQADPDAFKGKIIILGGTISQINTTKQGTLIEVIQKPLDYWGKPKRTKRTEGRFVVLHPGYLNTMIFTPGRQITVAAEVEGTRSKALGEMEFTYPLVLAKELKLWEVERQTWYTPGWIDPLNSPSGPPTNPAGE